MKIFLIEDDLFFGEAIKYHLKLNPNYDVSLFTSGKECLANMHLKPDIICLDFGLPDITGDQLLAKIKVINNKIPVIIISGQSDIAIAVNFLKSGANDYIVKGEHAKEMIWNSILKISENLNLTHEVAQLKEELNHKFSFENTVVGQSKALKNVFIHIQKAIQSNINVSITGETGTGKEVVAKAIHYNSERRNQPFVAVNMAALPRDLVESTFFGHEKGAFTSAEKRYIGKFEQAKEGTLFLDEIAELDLNLQAKLLRALEEREVVRVGGTEKIKIKARIITATNKDLAQEVKEGRFREDLYYRILGLPIILPPLRERENDILILAKYFIATYATENKVKLISLSLEAKDKLVKYSFPGNVRELKSAIELACVMCNGKTIEADDLTFRSINATDLFLSEHKTLKEYTTEIILHHLNKNNNDVIKTAQKLGIGKSTIYNLIQSIEPHN
jgi:DNA-binding NtrC family response regulator